MTELYNSVFALLKTALFDIDLKINSNVTWSEITSELETQCVLAVPADQTDLLDLTEAEQQQYFASVVHTITYWHSVMYEQQEILELFQEAGIPAAVLKGSAAAIYYPKPDYRTMGDIDLIVQQERFDEACKLMEQAGYFHLDGNNPRHESFMKNGIPVELHQKFAILNEKEQTLYLDNLIWEGLDHLEEKQIEEYTFTMLPRLENGLVLLDHISQHLESGLGLRQIMDWMLYVASELDDDFWKDTFCAEAERIGLKKLALVTTRMCQIYLGLTEKITWCQQAEEELCAELMLFVMNHGNFGRKDEASSKTVSVFYHMRSPVGFFKMLQSTGCNTWKLLKKYPWLKPFAWLYQLFRWGSRGMRRQDAIGGLLEDAGKAKREDVFLDKLGVTRRSKMER